MEVVKQEPKAFLVGLGLACSRLSADYHCLIFSSFLQAADHLRSDGVNMWLVLGIVAIVHLWDFSRLE